MKTIAATVYVLLAVTTQLAHADNYFEGCEKFISNNLNGNSNHLKMASLDDLVSSLASRAFGEKIKAFLENLKETMKNGNESIGVPQLDPFNHEHQEFDFKHYLLNATGEVNDLYVKSLSEFQVPLADFSLGKKIFAVKMVWPKLSGKTLFNISDAKLADYIPIFGAGVAKFEVSNLTFAINAKLKLDLKDKYNTKIIKFENTELSIDALQFIATGLFDDEDLSKYMSDLLSKAAPQGLIDFHEELVTELDAAMLEFGNKLLPSVIDAVWEIIFPKPKGH